MQKNFKELQQSVTPIKENNKVINSEKSVKNTWDW